MENEKEKRLAAAVQHLVIGYGDAMARAVDDNGIDRGDNTSVSSVNQAAMTFLLAAHIKTMANGLGREHAMQVLREIYGDVVTDLIEDFF